MGLRDRIPFLGSKFASKSIVYRNRSGTPVAELTEAVRMEYDDLPDIHQLKTGEETKAAELRGITQVYESDEPIYYIEHEGKILLFRGVTDSLTGIETANGQPLIHWYEAEAGQLLNFVPSFDVDGITGDVHDAVENGEIDLSDVTTVDSDDEDDDAKVAIENYIIDDKDERLTAHMDHLERAQEKYESGGFWSKHKDAAIVLAVAFGCATVIAITLHYLSDWGPALQQLTNQIPNLIQAIQNSGGGSPPPGQ